jgi:hypothetical protein
MTTKATTCLAVVRVKGHGMYIWKGEDMAYHFVCVCMGVAGVGSEVRMPRFEA